MPSASHDPMSCRLCESVPAGISRRHWKVKPKAGYWHVIGDGPDLMARLPRSAHFLTILAYRPGGDGSTTHYTGSLFFEFDAAHAADALNDLRRCLQLLDVELGCPLEAIHAWHSGSRGYHATIPARVIGAEGGRPLLPRIYGAMIGRLFPAQVVPTLDRSVYSSGKGRMWRLPNRRRSENGRYKVPIAMREALHSPSAEIEALTHRPRKGIFWPADDELSPSPALVELYQETLATLKDVRPAPTTDPGNARIRERARNATLARLAEAMRRRGASQEAITAVLQAENGRHCDPPLPDAEVVGIAASIARYQPTFSATSGGSAGIVREWGGIRTIPAGEVGLWPR